MTDSEIRAAAAYMEDGTLRLMCDSSGLTTKEEFLSGRAKLETLDSFNQSLPTMQPVIWFPRLTRLMLNNQNIKEISSLSELISLEYLWLSENSLTKISGLEGCHNLKELYVNSNQLTRLEGLSTLTKLEVLWAVDNQISVIEGIEKCYRLRVLWLACNRIDGFVGTLDTLQAIEELNFAGNKLWHLREIPTLEKLPLLRALYLSDPALGENPVCNICNYQTFTLFHLKRLKILDYITISEEQRQLAEATFFKKKIYYNMRIKTIQRNAWSLVHKAHQFKTSKLSAVNMSLAVLQRTSKELQRDLDDGVDLSTQMEVQMESKIKEITALTRYKLRNVDRIERYFDQMRAGIEVSTKDHISRLLTELHTGGNVRLEDGQPKDGWCQSCVELVRSRFVQSDFDSFGIKDIRIVRVIRVHNRLLRTRFDERLSQLVDVTEPSYKKAVEYLFYATPDPNPFDIMEDGFLSEGTEDACVPLTNSVFLADQTRLLRDRVAISNATELIPGRLVVCKAFLGKCAPERSVSIPDTGAPLVTSDPKVRRKDYAPQTSTVYRVKNNDAKQRVWFSFEHGVVIPEYIVEYVYCTTHTLPLAMLPEPYEKDTSKANMELRDVLDKLFPLRSDSDNADIKSVAHHFLTFVHSCNMLLPVQEAPMEVLSSGPMSKPYPKFHTLDHEAIMTISGQRPLNSVVTFNAVGLGLKKIEHGLQQLATLRVLILSFNEITRIENLSALPFLDTLDLSHNFLRRMEDLAGMPSLRIVDVSHNAFESVDAIWSLQTLMPDVTDVTMRGNAFRDYRKLQMLIIKCLPRLTTLDGTVITHIARVEAETAVCTTMTPQTMVRDSIGSKDMCTSHEEMNFLMRMTEIKMCGRHLSQVQNLEVARSVHTIHLTDNIITRMGGIGGIPPTNKLEELNLAGNFILRIEGLSEESHFARLRRLDLGRNRLLNVSGLEGCANLTFLSIENNEVSTLTGLQCLTNLMELYASNNAIDNVKEINYLRDISKLIVLDLAHNPLCLDADYRVYAVFNLKKLKVLDGIPIDTSESNNAREMLSGKMTLELLLERTGRQSTDSVRDLNLSGCSLKEIAQLHAYTMLQHLKLDHNVLTEISGVMCCTSLVSLNLAFNRLSGIGIGRHLESLTKLESISLESNAITTIAAMQLSLPSLKFLNLKNNEIVRVDGLDSLPGLRELILDKNRIRNFELTSFANNNLLKELRCEDNMLKALDGLRPLHSLVRLLLSNNRVTEVSEVEKLEGMDKITEVNLQGNSVVRKSLYRSMLIYRLPRLALIDGKEVTLEERDRTHQYYSQDYVGSQIPPNVYLDNRTVTVGVIMVAQVGVPTPPNNPSNIKLASGSPLVQFANQPGVGQVIQQPAGPGRGRAQAGVPVPVGPGQRTIRTSSAEGGAGTQQRLDHASSSAVNLRPRPKPGGPGPNVLGGGNGPPSGPRRTSLPR